MNNLILQKATLLEMRIKIAVRNFWKSFEKEIFYT